MATSTDIREHFQWLVDDDTLDEERELVLLNVAYDFLCAMRIWKFLKSTQSSQTVTAGTAAYNLPADHLVPERIILRNGATNSLQYMTPVRYDERLEYLNDHTKFYLDLKNGTFVFTKTPDSTFAGWTIYLDYQYQPAQLLGGSTPTSPVFNRAFHHILAYEMAKNYFYNDQGEKARAWNTEMAAEYTRMLQGMTDWDSMLDFAVDSQTRVPNNFPGLDDASVSVDPGGYYGTPA